MQAPQHDPAAWRCPHREGWDRQACAEAASVRSGPKAAAVIQGFPGVNCRRQRSGGERDGLPRPPPPESPRSPPEQAARARLSGQSKRTRKHQEPGRNKAPVPECERTPLRGQRPAPTSGAGLAARPRPRPEMPREDAESRERGPRRPGCRSRAWEGKGRLPS